MENIYKEKLDEIVYEFKDSYQNEEIRATMEYFFNELINRRRQDSYEGGLQASGLLFNNKAGFKINEENGNGEYLESQINLYRYLENKNKFYSRDGLSNFNLTIEDMRNMTLNGTLVTILCGENHMEAIFIKKFSQFTTFEKEIINKFIKCAKVIKDNNIIRKIDIRINTKNLDINEQLDNNSYIRLKELFRTNKKK